MVPWHPSRCFEAVRSISSVFTRLGRLGRVRNHIVMIIVTVTATVGVVGCYIAFPLDEPGTAAGVMLVCL